MPDLWQIGTHKIDAGEFKAAMRTLRADGWKGTRDRHGNWTFTHPDGDPPRFYARMVEDRNGRLVWADSGLAVPR